MDYDDDYYDDGRCEHCGRTDTLSSLIDTVKRFVFACLLIAFAYGVIFYVYWAFTNLGRSN